MNAKKLLAGASVLALVSMNSAFAAVMSLTGSTGTGLSLTGSDFTALSGSVASGTLNVQVSATVLPVLNFEIGTGSVALGNLQAGAYNSGALTYSGFTNARSGMNVTVKSATLLDDGNGNQIGTGTIGAQTGTEYTYATGATTTAATAIIGTVSDDNLSTSVAKTVATMAAKGSMSGALAVGATIDANTTAGQYSDVLTLTVTGNF